MAPLEKEVGDMVGAGKQQVLMSSPLRFAQDDNFLIGPGWHRRRQPPGRVRGLTRSRPNG